MLDASHFFAIVLGNLPNSLDEQHLIPRHTAAGLSEWRSDYFVY
jgi:hypothetical protein